MRLKKIKAIYLIWKHIRWEKKPFGKKMKEWLKWHKPFKEGEYCPSCGSISIRDNGNGFYRCIDCGKCFIILEKNDNLRKR